MHCAVARWASRVGVGRVVLVLGAASCSHARPPSLRAAVCVAVVACRRAITVHGKQGLCADINEQLWLPVLVPTMTHHIELAVRCCRRLWGGAWRGVAGSGS